MRMLSVALVIITVGFLTSCSDLVVEPSLSPSPDASVSTQDVAAKKASPGKVLNFVAPLSGRQEVPANDSRATGVAKFQLNKDGTELSFKLIVANIENVVQAHIHCGAAGVNGPVIAWLYTPEGSPLPIPGRFNGILAEGTITPDRVVARPDSPACPGGVANFDELLARIQAGETYVNVHTAQFPPGEIRGQIDRGNGMK